jgi:homoserine O-succinyltransferase
MMPDAALEATERQFLRLIGSSNPISQFYIHPFTLDAIPRSARARSHIEQYYEPLSVIQEQGLDALIITGANVTQPDLTQEIFWQPLAEVLEWAHEHVTSTLCSCLATHALVLNRYGIRRQGLQHKCWGVFQHDVLRRDHPLVHDVNTRMTVPHSRFNEVTREQLEAQGLHVLIEGDEPGVQLAVSPDGFRTVFFQGHPEYDRISLMKEYKRDVGLFIGGELTEYPPKPQHYFDSHTIALLDEYQTYVVSAKREATAPPVFPESLVYPRLHNTWHDSGEAVVGNWIGLVYQITNAQRALPFMDGVDPENPLGWLD